MNENECFFSKKYAPPFDTYKALETSPGMAGLIAQSVDTLEKSTTPDLNYTLPRYHEEGSTGNSLK